MNSTLPQLYQARAAAGRIRPDPAQEAVLPLLEAIRQRLSSPGRSWPRLLGLSRPMPPVRGCYIWGDVGRGKSMLIDLLAESLVGSGVRRIHFHAFLRDMHAGIHAAQQAGDRDPITSTIARFASGLRLLALDEMDVSDIGDAMIIDRVFRHLLDVGTVIVTTSNRPPEQLYRDGLKRELFLPFIALLRERLDVIQIESPKDWRRRDGATRSVHFWPLTDKTARDFDALWHEIAPGVVEPGQILSLGRRIRIGQAKGAMLCASFEELCGAPLGPSDYLELARRFRILFLDLVPRLDAAQLDAARRFVILVDALYEARCGLVIRAEVEPDALMERSLAQLGTARLTSRLAEMLDETWLTRAMRSAPAHDAWDNSD